MIKHLFLQKNIKFLNEKRKGINSEKIFPLVCSEYLSSWTGLGRSGHVRFPTFYNSLTRDTFRYLKRVVIQHLKGLVLWTARPSSPSCRLRVPPASGDRNQDARNQSFGKISHVSGPKLNFKGNFIMVLHGFASRSSKNTFFLSKAVIFY